LIPGLNAPAFAWALLAAVEYQYGREWMSWHSLATASLGFLCHRLVHQVDDRQQFQNVVKRRMKCDNTSAAARRHPRSQRPCSHQRCHELRLGQIRLGSTLPAWARSPKSFRTVVHSHHIQPNFQAMLGHTGADKPSSSGYRCPFPHHRSSTNILGMSRQVLAERAARMLTRSFVLTSTERVPKTPDHTWAKHGSRTAAGWNSLDSNNAVPFQKKTPRPVSASGYENRPRD